MKQHVLKNVFKRIIFFLPLTLLSNVSWAQTSDLSTYNIYCSNITSIEPSNAVKNYMLNNYTDKITSYEANLDQKTALITTNFAAIDILQLYRLQGYLAIFINDEGRFQLNDAGDQMILIKE